MPPHHHREKYHDWWYEDLPEGCKKAAAAMGYEDKAHWDEDKPVNYDDAKFSDLSLTEKRAAWHLGWNVIDDKLDIWWEDTDEDTKTAALAVGFTKETWDDDWKIQDFPIEHKYWEQLTDEEKAGAIHLGYTQYVWDESGETEWEDDGSPAPKLKKPSKKQSTGKEENEEVEEEEEVTDDEAEAAADTEPKKKKKLRFVVSKPSGGGGGAEFDDRNHKKVKKITVYAGALVDAIMMTYESGDGPRHGGETGGAHEFELEEDEYVKAVTVRSAKVVLCLTFHTNKGRDLGPSGGKGRLIDKIGQSEEKILAPKGLGLCGIKGKKGAYLDSIAFRWGTVR